MSPLQNEVYTGIIRSDDNFKLLSADSILGPDEEEEERGSGSRVSLGNVVMQLRKVCNHPYLVLEDCKSIPDELYDNFLISSSGKLLVLSGLLDVLIPQKHKVQC